MKKTSLNNSFRLVFVCGRRDLNPNPLQDTPLKRARMPIPPQPQSNVDNYSRVPENVKEEKHG